MKRLALSLLALFVVLAPAQAETVAEAAEKLAAESKQLFESLVVDQPSWGHAEALKDLQGLAAAGSHLAERLKQGADPDSRPEETLASARRRLKVSAAMLNADSEAQQKVASLLGQAEQLEERVRDYRMRFSGKAGVNLAAAPMEGSAELNEFENPEALLIEVRYLRQMAQSIRFRPFPYGAFGLANPDNLDPREVREFVLATQNLEQRLSVRYDDVRQTSDAWRRVQVTYNRLGYIPSNFNTRQLERSMERLQSFYSSLQQ